VISVHEVFLCDFLPPLGLRELAQRAGVDAGYASRIIIFWIVKPWLLVRRGPITHTVWPALIRRWVATILSLQRERVVWYLAPRGLTQALEGLTTLSERYVVKRIVAAAQFAPVSPTRLLLCYADDVATVSAWT